MNKTILGGTGVFVLLVCLAGQVLAIGQMTEPIVINEVLRGQEFIKEIRLFSSQETVQSYALQAEGDIESWVSFYSQEDTGFETALSQAEVPARGYLTLSAKINVPIDVPNATYLGQIVVATLPPEDSETGETSALVRQRVGREVTITITDQEIIQLEADIIPISYDLNQGESLEIKTVYHNQGNVLLTPDLGIKIKRLDETVFQAIFPYPETEEPVKPKTSKAVIAAQWSSAGQQGGRYLVEVTVLVEGEVIKIEEFSIVVSSSLDQFLSFISFIGFGNLTLAWVIIGLVIGLIILGLGLAIRRIKVRN